MSRQYTFGYESALGTQFLEGSATLTGTGAASLDTSTKRSGNKSLKLNGGSSGSARVTSQSGFAFGVHSYFRCYINPTALPTGVNVVSFMSAQVDFSTPAYRVLLDSSGMLIDNLGGTYGPISTNSWTMLELRVFVASAGSQLEWSWRANGTLIATYTNQGQYNAELSLFSPGRQGNNFDVFIDDVAINNSSGSSQNTYPGAGSAVLLLPVSDNARGTNWLDGGGGTTSLFEAVNNTPPTGSGTPANGTQVKNTAKDTTGNYDAKLTDYTTAGVPTTAIVTLVQPVYAVGSNATKTGTTGAEQFVSNPTGPAETSTDFSGLAAAAGTWPTNWRIDWLAAIVGDIAGANRSTQPVIRIGKRVSSTNAAYCCFMGAYVEYVPGAGAPPIFSQQRQARVWPRKKGW